MQSDANKSTSAVLRKHFLTGLAVGAPVALTLWLVLSAIMMIDGKVLPLIPRTTLPADAILRSVPGIGVVVFLTMTVLLGILAKGLIGRSFVSTGDKLISRVPVIRTIYSTFKQIIDTVVGQEGPKFQKACLVQYPRPGLWSIAFVSTNAKGEVAKTVSDDGKNVLSLFMPTTPNPTSGFLFFVPETEVKMLDMGVDEAIKLVISAGLIYPPELPAAQA